jgi:hypothetical protein
MHMLTYTKHTKTCENMQQSAYIHAYIKLHTRMPMYTCSKIQRHTNAYCNLLTYTGAYGTDPHISTTSMLTPIWTSSREPVCVCTRPFFAVESTLFCRLALPSILLSTFSLILTGVFHSARALCPEQQRNRSSRMPA